MFGEIVLSLAHSLVLAALLQYQGGIKPCSAFMTMFGESMQTQFSI
jgi:hypothetical protein